MRIRLLYLALGTGLGVGGYHAYRQYKPQRTYSFSTHQMINSYIASNQLQQGYLVTVLNSLGFLIKGFYNYGMDSKLKGFNYNSTYLKRDQVRDEQKAITHLSCIFSPTQYICGHPQIQHGGATATIIDHNFGYLAILNTKSSVVTASLSINYKRPIKKDQFYIFQGRVVERDGRKIKVKGVIKQLQTGQIKVETQGLFVTVNWDNQLTRVLNKFFQTINFKDYSDVHHYANNSINVEYRQQQQNQPKQKQSKQNQNQNKQAKKQQSQTNPTKKLSRKEQIQQLKSQIINRTKAEKEDNERLGKLQQLFHKLQQRQRLVQINTKELQNLIYKEQAKHSQQK